MMCLVLAVSSAGVRAAAESGISTKEMTSAGFFGRSSRDKTPCSRPCCAAGIMLEDRSSLVVGVGGAGPTTADEIGRWSDIDHQMALQFVPDGDSGTALVTPCGAQVMMSWEKVWTMNW